MTVEAVLKNKGNAVFMTTPDAVIGDVVPRFKRNKAGSLIVIDHAGKVAGVLTERDIVNTLGEKGADILALQVSAVMTKAKLKCRPEDSIARALEIMGRSKTRYLPVVTSGRLIGVISMTDLVSAKLEEVQADNDWMMEYISGDYSIAYEQTPAD